LAAPASATGRGKTCPETRGSEKKERAQPKQPPSGLEVGVSVNRSHWGSKSDFRRVLVPGGGEKKNWGKKT